MLSQGKSAVDPFTNEIIAPHDAKDPEESEVYWLLCTFAHHELRWAIKFGVKFLRVFLVLWISLWVLVCIASGVLWWHFPTWYIVWGYLLIAATCIIVYNGGRLAAVKKLISRSVSVEQIQHFINGNVISDKGKVN